MNRFFSEYWWIFLLRGIFGVLIGLLALFLPGITFTTFVIFLGAFLFVSGVFDVITAVNSRKTMDSWSWYLVSGILGIAIGLLTLYNAFATALAFLYLVSFWLIVAGVFEIVIAIRMRREIKGEGWYIVGGLLTVLFGIMIMVNPVAGAITLTIILGVYAIIFGILLIYLSVRLRKRRSHDLSRSDMAP